MNENFDVVDLSDQPLCQAPREQVHRENLFHRAVHILVARTSSRLILQQRSESKDLDPFLWTSSCSGHVDAGEDYLCAAIRECEEELGLVEDRKSFKEVFRTSPCSETGNEFVRVYLLMSEQEIEFNRDEIIQTKEFAVKEIEYLIKKQPEVFSVSFKHLFPFIKKGIWLNESSLP
ncbi:MAG: NUDIX domain-containing protein [Opitutales bacterium]|jgi:isopentenyl-diphosphate delta-isomerase